MNRFARTVLLLALLTAPLAACGGDEPTTTGTPAPEASSRLLEQDLPLAVGVIAAKEAEVGTEVTVFGRIRDLADGAISLTDNEEIAYCGQECEMECETPWDYCCINPSTVIDCSLAVEVVDENGEPVPQSEMGLRLLDLVVLEGTLLKDEDDALYLRSTKGWFRRERPTLPDYVRWP
ncbi:MAG: hypothetical protein ACYTG6_09920 [Planctomycetota bacterium]|jgi:hypothetical protein